MGGDLCSMYRAGTGLDDGITICVRGREGEDV